VEINIVGGGLTGCILALKASALGAKVNLLEASEHLGGVLRDYSFNDSLFFNGCQYLDNTPKGWLDDMPSSLKTKLHEFTHEYGSVTELFDTQELNNDFAQPVVHDLADINSTTTGPCPEQLIERINLYGKHSAGLNQWISRWTDNESLHADCVYGMQISRIFFNKDISGLIQDKANSSRTDELTGIPRTILNPNIEKVSASLPVNGFNDFFDELETILISNNINVFKRTPVKPELNTENTIECISRGQHYTADHIIWCANPLPLFIKMGLGRLDSPFSDMFCGVALLNKTITAPIYHQIFSAHSSITRIYAYQINGQAKVSVEGFWGEQSQESIQKDLDNYLSIFDLPSRQSNMGCFKQRRYVNFTVRDRAIIDRFNNTCSHFNLLPGAWHLYGRDQKIEFMSAYLKDL
jgi:hypothetical protein